MNIVEHFVLACVVTLLTQHSRFHYERYDNARVCACITLQAFDVVAAMVQHLTRLACAFMVITLQKAQEESDTSAWGAEVTVEEDREERLVRELTGILGQNKASYDKIPKYDLTRTVITGGP